MPQVVEIKGVGKVNFPDGMSQEQIQQAIERDVLPQIRQTVADSSEHAARAEAFEREAAEMRPEAPPFWARLGRGMLDVGQGIKQGILQIEDAMGTKAPVIYDEKTNKYIPDPKFKRADPTAAEYTARVNDEIALYEKGRGPDAGFDWTRLAGNAAATAPLALVGGPATLGGRAVTGAIQGGISGGVQFAPSGTGLERARNTTVGAGIGAVATPAVGALTDFGGKVAQKMTGYLRGMKAGTPNVDDVLVAVPELKQLPAHVRGDLIVEAQKMVATTGQLDEAQLARKANLLAQGVKPTKSMVTRDPAHWTLERNLQKLSQSPDEELSKVGRELTDVYTQNDAALTQSLQKLQRGLPKGTQEAHGMKVMQSLDDLADASQQDVGKLYETVRAAKGDQLASDARQLVSTLDDLRDATYAEKLVGSVTNKLKRFGMIDKDGNPTNNTLTVQQAEELRKFVNKLPNDFGKKDIIKAIDADVLSGMGEDAFAGARGAAQQRFAMLENPATQRALNTLGELSQGKTAQNFVKSQVIDAADQDVATLVSTLGKLPQEQAQEAMSALRAGILQHLESKAINPNSGQFSGASLNKALEQIGENKLIRILGPEQFKQLRNLSRAALDATYQPPYSAVNNSNTAPMLLSLMRRTRGTIGIPLPGINEVAERGLERMSAQSQLADVLAARSAGQPPQVPPAFLELARALRAGSAPASAAALNTARNKPDDPRNKRK